MFSFKIERAGEEGNYSSFQLVLCLQYIIIAIAPTLKQDDEFFTGRVNALLC